jgi:hypothetical protein
MSFPGIVILLWGLFAGDLEKYSCFSQFFSEGTHPRTARGLKKAPLKGVFFSMPLDGTE